MKYLSKILKCLKIIIVILVVIVAICFGYFYYQVKGTQNATGSLYKIMKPGVSIEALLSDSEFIYKALPGPFSSIDLFKGEVKTLSINFRKGDEISVNDKKIKDWRLCKFS